MPSGWAGAFGAAAGLAVVFLPLPRPPALALNDFGAAGGGVCTGTPLLTLGRAGLAPDGRELE